MMNDDVVWIYERVEDKVYRRKFLDYDNREEVN